MAYGQPDAQSPPWAPAIGAPTPTPAATDAPFLAWLDRASRASPDTRPVEASTPILPPPPESPVPDVAFAPPESPVPDVAWGGPPLPWDAADIEIETPPAVKLGMPRISSAGPDPGPLDPYADPALIESDVDPALTGNQDPTTRKPINPYGPGYVDPDVDPALVGDQDPTIRKPLDPYANGDIIPGRTFGAPVGYAPTPADRSEQDRLVTPLDPYDPGAIDARRNAMADAYANADPEERLRMQAREQALQASQRQIMELDASERDRQALEEAVAIRKAARAKADAETADLAASAKAMADASPIESWWADRSTGAKIANVVAAVFGGLMSSKTGGRNSAIDTMMQVADADAAQKWKKLQARREMNADARRAAEEDFLGAERVRLASREQMRRTIEAKLAGLDPEGTQAIQLGEAIAASRAADAAALAAWRDKAETRASEDAKQALEVAKYQLEVDKANDASNLAWKKFQRAGQGGVKSDGLLGDKAVHTVGQWLALAGNPKLDIPAEWLTQEMTGKDFKTLLDIHNKGGNLGESGARAASVEQSTGIAKSAITINDPLTGDALGEIPDEKRRVDATEKLKATAQATQVIDSIIRLARESGGNLDIAKNPEWQKIVSNTAVLDQLNRAGFNMGALDAGAMVAMKQIRGGVNPNSFIYDATPGLLNLRRQLVTGTNLALKAGGITRPWTPPNASNPSRAPADPALRAVAAKEQDRQPFLSADPVGSLVDTADQLSPVPLAKIVPGGSTVAGAAKTAMRAVPGVGMLFGGSPAGLAGEAAGYVANKISPSDTEAKRASALDLLAAQIQAGGPEAEAAARGLAQIARSRSAGATGQKAAMTRLVRIIGEGGPGAAIAADALTNHEED